MARKDNRIKTKANYTLSKRHVLAPDGAIYEHDYFTIQELGEDEQTFSDSNFKFKIRPGGNPRKRHARGKWDEWESNGKTGDKWTLDTVDETVSKDTKIVIKPDYSSLRDFACYGSATELIRASVNDIVQHFPGSIILTTEPANETSDDDGNKVTVPIYDLTGDRENPALITGTLYKVSNETLVDVDSPSNISLGDDEDKLKFLQLSIDDYCDASGNDITAATIKQAEYPWCDGTIVARVMINGTEVLVYYKDSQKYLLSRQSGDKVLAKVKEKKVKEYFDALDDFERVLLDRSSKPLYCAKFETPYMDDYGYHYRMESYIFPTVREDDITPDLSSSAYSMYLERLIKLADFHDNYDSDNIWRMMTHEAIKNLDWTFIRNKDGEVEDASDIDSTRIGKILRIYGREYDDILLMINGIKSSNRITYDEKNNTPDYFLSDQNELSGWELTNVSPTTDNTLTVKIGVKNGENNKEYKEKYYEEYNGVDANSAFLRRLKLNSNYINSMKGTRQGIETLLGLFGMISKERAKKLGKEGTEDYELKEYIAKSGKITGVTSEEKAYEDIVKYNSKKDMESGESVDIDPLSGLPVALVEETSSNGQTTKKVIPWFDPNLKYDGDTYFQMKGGWGKVEEKDIKLEIAPNIDTIKAKGEVELYSETLGYLRFADTLTEMLEFNFTDLRDNDVCYVTNISKLSDYDDSADVNNASHYFILKNKNYSTIIGKDKESGCIGWKSISKQEIENNSTEDATRVLYLESLKLTEKGNNPHCGYGAYDNGEEYLNRFEHIFGYAVDKNMFSSLEKTEIDDIKKIGFDISDPEEDNIKIEYFKDGSIDFNKLLCKPENDKNKCESWDKVKEESDADEIMNVKKFSLEFTSSNKDDAFKKARKDYIVNVIMPFVEQMIPSTAIFEYKIA